MVIIFALLLCFCPISTFALQITFSPSEQNKPPVIRIKDIESSKITIALCTKKSSDSIYCSIATFETYQGVVSTDKNAPIDGAYSALDPYGLFWSMTRFDRKELESINYQIAQKLDNIPFNDALLVLKKPKSEGGQILSTLQISNAELPLIIQEIHNATIHGLLYKNSKIDPPASVFMLGGCPESGDISESSAYLASLGFEVFQAYYTSKNNPQSNSQCAGNIDLIAQALAWFRQSNPRKKIVVIGKSRGAEAAWWLAHFYPNFIDGIISFNGTTIQMPSLLGGRWEKGTEKLPTLEPKISTISAKMVYRASNVFSQLTGSTQKNSQRNAIEGELQDYADDAIKNTSIPINCNIPALAIFSEEDELIPIPTSINLMKNACDGKVDILFNKGASHHTFELGWEKYRCGDAEKRIVTSNADNNLCVMNTHATKRNLNEIVKFLTRFTLN